MATLKKWCQRCKCAKLGSKIAWNVMVPNSRACETVLVNSSFGIRMLQQYGTPLGLPVVVKYIITKITPIQIAPPVGLQRLGCITLNLPQWTAATWFKCVFINIFTAERCVACRVALAVLRPPVMLSERSLVALAAASFGVVMGLILQKTPRIRIAKSILAGFFSQRIAGM